MMTYSPPSHHNLRIPPAALAGDTVGDELARLLVGVVDYDVLRAASDGDFGAVRRELRRLRRVVDRAERLLTGTDPAC
jgi:hypothetical protein